MSGCRIPHTGPSESVDVQPVLSTESQENLQDALNDAVTPEDAWVEENRRDLFRAFATGKRNREPLPYHNIETFSAEEGTRKDLRYTLVCISYPSTLK